MKFKKGQKVIMGTNIKEIYEVFYHQYGYLVVKDSIGTIMANVDENMFHIYQKHIKGTITDITYTLKEVKISSKGIIYVYESSYNRDFKPVDKKIELEFLESVLIGVCENRNEIFIPVDLCPKKEIKKSKFNVGDMVYLKHSNYKPIRDCIDSYIICGDMFIYTLKYLTGTYREDQLSLYADENNLRLLYDNPIDDMLYRVYLDGLNKKSNSLINIEELKNIKITEKELLRLGFHFKCSVMSLYGVCRLYENNEIPGFVDHDTIYLNEAICHLYPGGREGVLISVNNIYDLISNMTTNPFHE